MRFFPRSLNLVSAFLLPAFLTPVSLQPPHNFALTASFLSNLLSPILYGYVQCLPIVSVCFFVVYFFVNVFYKQKNVHGLERWRQTSSREHNNGINGLIDSHRVRGWLCAPVPNERLRTAATRLPRISPLLSLSSSERVKWCRLTKPWGL